MFWQILQQIRVKAISTRIIYLLNPTQKPILSPIMHRKISLCQLPPPNCYAFINCVFLETNLHLRKSSIVRTERIDMYISAPHKGRHKHPHFGQETKQLGSVSSCCLLPAAKLAHNISRQSGKPRAKQETEVVAIAHRDEAEISLFQGRSTAPAAVMLLLQLHR